MLGCRWLRKRTCPHHLTEEDIRKLPECIIEKMKEYKLDEAYSCHFKTLLKLAIYEYKCIHEYILREEPQRKAKISRQSGNTSSHLEVRNFADIYTELLMDTETFASILNNQDFLPNSDKEKKERASVLSEIVVTLNWSQITSRIKHRVI